MKRFDDVIATRVEDGKETNLTKAIPPQVYTSVADWKPIPPDKFIALLHAYQTQDQNLDRFGHCLMHQQAHHLGPRCNGVIHYTVKEQDSPVSSPVLMTITYEDTKKVICFAHLHYGMEAEVG